MIWKPHRADVKKVCVLFSHRLGVLATPDVVVARPVPQLSIPINGNFEVVRGMLYFCFVLFQIHNIKGTLCCAGSQS